MNYMILQNKTNCNENKIVETNGKCRLHYGKGKTKRNVQQTIKKTKWQNFESWWIDLGGGHSEKKALGGLTKGRGSGSGMCQMKIRINESTENNALMGLRQTQNVLSYAKMLKSSSGELIEKKFMIWETNYIHDDERLLDIIFESLLQIALFGSSMFDFYF